MSGINLSQEVGPLPLGAWAAVVAGGLGIAYWRKKQAAAAAPVDTSTSVDTSGVPGVGTGAVGGYVDNTTTTPAASNAITDNVSWGRAATNYLIAQNYDPALSDSAVRKYLASASLSVSEYALIKVVLLKFGTPPEALAQLPAAAPVTPVAAAPAPPVSVPGPVYAAPAPAPAPAAAPAHVYYVVRPGDSLSRIAARYPQSWITWQSIYNNNRSLIGSNPNMIHPGQNLLIY